MDIKGIDKAELLAALYNASWQQGLGFLHSRGTAKMTKEQAQVEISLCLDDLYFDYLHGRPLKIDLNGDTLETRLYNRDNGGEGAAEEIVYNLRDAMVKGEK